MIVLAALLFAVSDPAVDAVRERLLTAEAVAKAKHNSGAAVEDRVREREVIGRAVRLAVKTGVDPEVALKVFTAQIEANKNAQRAFLNRWKNRGPFDPAPDLAKEVRPKLDAITPVLVDGLKRRRYRAATEFTSEKLDPIYRDAWKIATAPLIQPRELSHR